MPGSGGGDSSHRDDRDHGNGHDSGAWSDGGGDPWRGKEAPPWGAPTPPWGAPTPPWGGKPWGGGKRPSPWYDKHAAPWSRGAEVYGETVNVVIDRRTAENIYYALATALGGIDWSEPVGDWSRKTPKGHGKHGGKRPRDTPDPWKG